MKRIGFLTANLHIGSSRVLWPGLADAAERLNVNLVCYVGGSLHRKQAGADTQRNAVYDLVDPGSLDGLISWTSTIGEWVDSAQLQTFHQRFSPVPVLTLARLEGYPELAIDSYLGMRAAIQHLIEVHGYRRLAFIRGPHHHFYAQERYRAYREALHAYGIPLNPALITRPLPWDAGAEGAAALLDERGLQPGRDFQALVGVSDILALAAMNSLQARGYRIPQDVAVVGLNDTVESRLSFPPLTSVALPFYQQGARALEMLLAHPGGSGLAPRTLLDAHLVIRQSCGCPSPAVMQAAGGELPYRGTPRPAVRALAQAELGEQIAQTGGGSEQINQLLVDLANPAAGQFLTTLEALLDQAISTGRDAAGWQNVLSALRRALLPYVDGTQRAAVEDLIGQGRVLVSEKAQRALAYQQFQVGRQAELLRAIGQELMTTFEIPRLADALARRLPQVGIPGCYLALYENPNQSLEQARLMMACTSHGLAVFEPDGLPFAARQLLPEGILPPDRRVSLVVEPLYFDDEPMGFVLFEAGPRDGTIYEALRGYLSSALKGALLLKEAQRARVAAEKADAIKSRLLANVSHELRTPLNIIVDHAQQTQSAPDAASLRENLRQIEQHARHQLRVINDLLDLSRAEIEALDLYLEMLDPGPLLADAFESMARTQSSGSSVAWQLELPTRLPSLRADPVRLRQILLNLLSNASRFTPDGQITLGAEVLPPHLHIWVADTGLGIPTSQQELIFEPFMTIENSHPRPTRARVSGSDKSQGGIGLGLSITRRLVALHSGKLTLESQPGQGSTFHVYLPLPRLDEAHGPTTPAANSGWQAGSSEQTSSSRSLLLISANGQPADEVRAFCQRAGLQIILVEPGMDLDALLQANNPAAIAWDLSAARPGDWRIVRRLRNHPCCGQTPFILYRQSGTEQPAPGQGLTSFVTRTAGFDSESQAEGTAGMGSAQSLLDWINAARPPSAEGPILIVDDDEQARAHYVRLLKHTLPHYPYETAANGLQALALMADETPSLVILDLIMPQMDGFAVLEWIRAQPHLRGVPVLIVSSRMLTLSDVHRLEDHLQVSFQSKGLLTDQEMGAAFQKALLGIDSLPPQTSAMVKQALAYIHQNYTRSLARWEIAAAVGASEDYLGRVFRRELGLSPWDYLNRCRVHQAKELLLNTNSTIRAVSHQVGFKDAAYFSRVFHKVCGLSPADFRKSTN